MTKYYSDLVVDKYPAIPINIKEFGDHILLKNEKVYVSIGTGQKLNSGLSTINNNFFLGFCQGETNNNTLIGILMTNEEDNIIFHSIVSRTKRSFVKCIGSTFFLRIDNHSYYFNSITGFNEESIRKEILINHTYTDVIKNVKGFIFLYENYVIWMHDSLQHFDIGEPYDIASSLLEEKIIITTKKSIRIIERK